jgi:hypothetical protein
MTVVAALRVPVGTFIPCEKHSYALLNSGPPECSYCKINQLSLIRLHHGTSIEMKP